MSTAYSRIVAAIKAYADSVGGLLQVILGSTGVQVYYPEDRSLSSSALRDTGAMWVPDTAIPTILKYIGAEIDGSSLAWCDASTGNTGVAPIVNASKGVASVQKVESTNTVEVNFSTNFSSDKYFATALIAGIFAVPVITFRDVDYVEFQFQDEDGVAIDINTRAVVILCCGTY